MSSIFRSLIIASGLLMLASSFTPFAYENTDDRNLWQLLQWDGYSGTVTPFSAIYGVWSVVHFGVLAGLYCYWRPARTMFVVLLVLSIVLAAFEGVRVAHPLEVMLASITYPLYGALIAISYLTSVANKFDVTERQIAENIK